ncbi:stage II sporulation protein M [Paenibacillus shirakamiensis]|uniref:Stage II sporulation protein M n=1 Tax=Paenibacillus shirakamiensis TaxID=1265935 RepID=A0ABS4JNT6_9BACL|nr:stage II sporulation protein M [Paenibacillus shirakamiensis]MBP2002676.1 stage II sporulation protein M [Paenibacillus shirakamiensis]
MLSLKQFLKDLGQLKQALLFSVLLFAAGIVLGTVNAESIQNFVAPQLKDLTAAKDMLSQSRIPELSFFIFIFFNNAIKAVLIIYAGILLGILPAIFLMMNGLILGYFIVLQASRGQSISDLIFVGLLPHGIIEIPAIIIACAYGMKFGRLVLKKIVNIFSKNRSDSRVEWKTFMKTSIRASFWIVILLFIAAIIESTLTYHLVQSLK